MRFQMNISLNVPITDDVDARFLLRLPICIRGWALLATDTYVREVWAQKEG